MIDLPIDYLMASLVDANLHIVLAIHWRKPMIPRLASTYIGLGIDYNPRNLMANLPIDYLIGSQCQVVYWIGIGFRFFRITKYPSVYAFSKLMLKFWSLCICSEIKITFSPNSSSSDSGSDNEDESRQTSVMSMPSFGSVAPPSMPSFAAAPPPPPTKSNGPPPGRAPLPPPQRAPAPRAPAPPPQRAPAAPPKPTAAISMPQFLNDDLQLSESEDDSD